MSAEARVRELGLDLPPPATAAAGIYVPAVRTGNLVVISGQVPMRDGNVLGRGKLGRDVSVEEAALMARRCAEQALGVLRAEVGSLDDVVRVVRLGGFVACTDGFNDQPLVVNGASQLMVDVFGEAGRHARSSVGVFELPLGVPVEVEFMFEVR